MKPNYDLLRVFSGKKKDDSKTRKEVYFVFYHDRITEVPRIKKLLDKSMRKGISVDGKGEIDKGVQNKVFKFLSNNGCEKVGFQVLLFPKEMSVTARDEVKVREFSIPFENTELWGERLFDFMLKCAPENIINRSERKDYTEPGKDVDEIDDTNDMGKLTRQFSVKAQFSENKFADRKEVAKNSYRIYKMKELLYMCYQKRHVEFYGKLLPDYEEMAKISGESITVDRRYTVSPKVDLFLSHCFVGWSGPLHNLMVLYSSSPKTISIAFRPDEPLHYARCEKGFEEGFHDGIWSEVVDSYWNDCLVNRFKTAIQNSPSEEVVESVKIQDKKSQVAIMNSTSEKQSDLIKVKKGAALSGSKVPVKRINPEAKVISEADSSVKLQVSKESEKKVTVLKQVKFKKNAQSSNVDRVLLQPVSPVTTSSEKSTVCVYCEKQKKDSEQLNKSLKLEVERLKVNSNMARADAKRAENKKKELSEKLRQAHLEKQELINEKNKLTAQLAASENKVVAENKNFTDMQAKYINLQDTLLKAREEVSKEKITVERYKRTINQLRKKEDKEGHEGNKRARKDEQEGIPVYAKGLVPQQKMNYYTPRENH
ncbi:hypothetical protein [Endozoicomonas sp. Mp262]|uniref:hypothetical protein n=1 Tax=Endozoicomonas sp. Mp262 TaxID=2919499 RepID=UPI0021D9E84C